jgi:hypothetical protein
MIGLLKNIIEVISFIPQYFLYALETFYNLFIDAIQALFSLATSLIPLPEIPAVPEYVSTINWFFPIGSIITIVTPVLIGYIAFLVIRWIYAKSGNL